MDPIMEIAKKHNLYVIEDACEAIRASYKGGPTGAIGEFGVYGFYPNKQITTGEGGMITTNNKELAVNKVKVLINFIQVSPINWLMIMS